MTTYGLKLSQHPDALDDTIATARLADQLGADLVSVSEHPFLPDEMDGMTVLTTLAAHTDRVRLSTNVATLPLRPPAMFARQAAALQQVSAGRLVLGLGAGEPLPRIAGLGGPDLTTRQSVDALAEGIEVLRALWRGDAPVHHDGTHYRLVDATVGPAPNPSIPIWVGAFGPRMLGITGRLADGWLPTNYFLELADVPTMQRRIDDAATSAGRDPDTITRAFNVFGLISDTVPTRNDRQLHGPVDFWVDALRDYVRRLRFDTIVYWPNRDQQAQTELFLREVVPRVG